MAESGLKGQVLRSLLLIGILIMLDLGWRMGGWWAYLSALSFGPRGPLFMFGYNFTPLVNRRSNCITAIAAICSSRGRWNYQRCRDGCIEAIPVTGAFRIRQ